jgi:DnaJ-class molecular chaperone
MTRVQEAREPEGQAGRLAEGFEDVTCYFCGGRGTDPFGIMSWYSTCVVCSGKGKVLAPESRRRCAHCRGTGAIKRLTCTTCHGTGFVPGLPGPLQDCPECRGSGDDGSIPAMACQRCRGWGVVPRRAVNK